MSPDNVEKMISLLAEIRDGQRLQLERQVEAMALQREQFALAQRQMERAERLQERAEQLQTKSADLVQTGRKAMGVVLVLLVAALIYLLWIMF